MTALCGGGASAPKAGVAATIIFTSASLGSLLNNKGGYWATLAAPLLGVLAYQGTELCTADPPALPTISNDEYTALLQLGPWDTLQAALVKLAALVTRVVWFDLCECTTVPTPALPGNTLAPPTGVGLPDYTGAGSCPTPRARITIPDALGSTYTQWNNRTALLFPGRTLYKSVADGSNAAGNDAIRIQPSWTGLTLRLRLISGTTPGASSYGLFINYLNNDLQAGGTPLALFVTEAAPTASASIAFTATTARFLMFNHSMQNAVVGPGVVDVEIDMACGTPTEFPTGCCSDPAALALMGQLLQQVNLIQRQQVPFGYVHGVPTAGLSGSGELDLVGVVGALVELTATSSVVGEEAGTPELVFDAGWIAWGNADGFSQREWVQNGTLVSFPALGGQYTRLGYTLAVGVTATITPLLREP